MDEKPNYYAIIPADVRYDEKLKLGEKMMYGEITALSKKNGICYASNNYFAKLYNVSPQAISKWIKNLEKNNYISISYERDGKAIIKRNISMVSTQVDRVSTEVEGGINSGLEGYQQEIKENNTSINNTSIKNKEIYKESIEEIINYLNNKIDTHYRTTTPKTKQLIIARLNEGFKVDDFKTVIDNKYSTWFKDKKMCNYLRPETLFGTKFENYLNEKVKKRLSDEELINMLKEMDKNETK